MEQLTSTGRTTGGYSYWRYINERINSRYFENIQEAFEAPRNFDTLTFHFRTDKGQPTQLGEFTMELVFWEKLK